MDAQRGEVFATLYAPTGTGDRPSHRRGRPARSIDAWADTRCRRERRGSSVTAPCATRHRSASGSARTVVLHHRPRRPDRPDGRGRSRARGPARTPSFPSTCDKPDAELARYRRADVSFANRTGWSSIAFWPQEDLDAVVALEADDLHQPLDPRDARAGAASVGRRRVYVLRAMGKRVAAFCACWLIFDELHINTVAVDPALRRQGLAIPLMEHVLADAARHGADRTSGGPAVERARSAPVSAALGSPSQAVRPRYYTSPEEDALYLVAC